MKLNFNDILFSFSYALDCIEHELVGVTTNHSKRVVYLAVLMGKELGLNKQELTNLSTCAILHDNALTEYIMEEYDHDINNIEIRNLNSHCIIGERNLNHLSFLSNAKGAILYHHENADGSGPFGKKADEVPLFAQLIHIADDLDSKFDLSSITNQKINYIVNFIEHQKDILYSSQCVQTMQKLLNNKAIDQLQTDNLEKLLRELIPDITKEYSNDDLYAFSTIFANIIDYKSRFTKNHSLDLAKKAALMGEYYRFHPEVCTKLYFAGAVHDLGKLVVNINILEKPGGLTPAEYLHIKKHAYYSYEMLRKIKGLEDVTLWACSHHELLNGKGYPFGKTEKDLCFHERLLACLDIYQALTETRPYKKPFPHEKAIHILRKMSDEGKLDKKIIEDIDIVFSNTPAFI